jgi:hypothetical protein
MLATNGPGLPKPGIESQERAAGNWLTFFLNQFTAAQA